MKRIRKTQNLAGLIATTQNDLTPSNVNTLNVNTILSNFLINDGEWKTWVPTFVGFSSAPSSGVYRYKQIGKTVILAIRQIATGTSNSSSFKISLPVPAKVITSMSWLSSCAIQDNGVRQVTPGSMEVSSDDPTNLLVWKDLAGAGFTASGQKRIVYGEIIYEAA